jgi:anti-sigma B factor antagonist
LHESSGWRNHLANPVRSAKLHANEISRLSGSLQPEDGAELSIDVDREPGRHVLVLSGDLDLTAASRLLDAVRQSCAEDAGEVVIDVSAVQFLDSSGLRAMLDAATVCEEHMCEFRLRPPREQVPPQVSRLLQITGLFERLPFPPAEAPEPHGPAGENGSG